MNKYYTVEEISAMLSMHPKTIQRYIREGKLPASKIGKGWRVAGHDLSVFAESTGKQNIDERVQSEDKVMISAVMDIRIDDFEESSRIVNALTAALNCKPREYGKSTMYVQHLEHENKVRVTLWGNILFMREMTGFVAVMMEQ